MSKKIHWREEIINLFPDVTERVLKENETFCEACQGLGLKRLSDSIAVCRKCSGTGIIALCSCGNERKRGYTLCEDCYKRNREEDRLKAIEEAEKILYKDYDGCFIWNDRVIEKEELEDCIYDAFCEGKTFERYIPSTKKVDERMDLDLVSIISSNADDYYEEFLDYIDLDSEKLRQAQHLINEWVEENHQAFIVYYEDLKRLVDLEEIIEEIGNEFMKSRRESSNELCTSNS